VRQHREANLLEISRVLVRFDQVASLACGDGKRFVVRADEKLTAFVELESATRGEDACLNYGST
jgi:hypothetical protein